MCKARWGFNVNHNLINTGLKAREIAMSDNSLHSLKPRKGNVSDLLSEHVTCSGIQPCACLCGSVFMCCRAAVCDYACLMSGCCTCSKCHGWFLQKHLPTSSVVSFCSAGSSEGGRDGLDVSGLTEN